VTTESTLSQLHSENKISLDLRNEGDDIDVDDSDDGNKDDDDTVDDNNDFEDNKMYDSNNAIKHDSAIDTQEKQKIEELEVTN